MQKVSQGVKSINESKKSWVMSHESWVMSHESINWYNSRWPDQQFIANRMQPLLKPKTLFLSIFKLAHKSK